MTSNKKTQWYANWQRRLFDACGKSDLMVAFVSDHNYLDYPDFQIVTMEYIELLERMGKL